MKSILPLLLIAVSVGLFYLHIDPRYMQVQTLLGQKSEYSAALAKSEELQQKKNALLNQYNNLSKDDLARLEKLLPNNLNTVKLVADIDGIAGKRGITVRSVRVTEQQADRSQQVSTDPSAKPYQTTVVSFRFSATYDNLVMFLRDLEQSLQLIDVKTITFQAKNDKDDKAGIYDYDVSFQTYWIK
jgi:Tfp pilus assembly protein PilO